MFHLSIFFFSIGHLSKNKLTEKLLKKKNNTTLEVKKLDFSVPRTHVKIKQLILF